MIIRLVLLSSGPSPYYMLILFPLGIACMKFKFKRPQLGTEFDRRLSCFKYFLPIYRSQH